MSGSRDPLVVRFGPRCRLRNHTKVDLHRVAFANKRFAEPGDREAITLSFLAVANRDSPGFLFAVADYGHVRYAVVVARPYLSPDSPVAVLDSSTKAGRRQFFAKLLCVLTVVVAGREPVRGPARAESSL